MRKNSTLLLSVALLGRLSVAHATVVFNEGFSGSTVSAASPAAPTASATDYAVLSSKNATGSTILNLSLSSGTSSGFAEMQARFASSPITLDSGESIILQMTFQGTGLLDSATANQSLNVGLFNSGGSYPVPGGGMANAGMGTGTSFVTGYTQSWAGYVGRVSSPSGNGSSIYTRDPQSDTSNENQDVLFNGVGTGAYDLPVGQNLAAGADLNLTDGPDYTLVFTVLNDGANIQVSEDIYAGFGTGGTSVYHLSGTAPASYQYTTFDSLAFGARFSSSIAPAITVSALSVEVPAEPDTAPSISNLNDVMASVGDHVTLTPTVTGSPVLTYQWQENGFDLSGETNATLTLPNVQTNQNGNVYALIAGNAAGSDTNSMTLTVFVPPAQLPAFPGAEGAGANALGGRGGDVYYVTTLTDDNNPGSLRYGINTAPAGGRTICFKVSGNIVLNSVLSINRARITVAGQTAPGDGICLQDYSLRISADDTIVRHLRSRLGTNALQEDDCIWINSGANIIVDHVSTSWSVDESFSCSADAANVTVQNCFITEALKSSIHTKGDHSYGSLLRADRSTTYSFLRNLYAHNTSRNPRVGTYSAASTLRLDFRNNVIYNYGGRAGYTGDTNENCEINYVGNYCLKGPSSTYNYILQGGAATTHVYQDGNFIDLNRNGAVDGSDTGWGMFSGSYTSFDSPFAVPAATTESAPAAYERVVALSGAMPWRRDSNDQRIAQTVCQQNGTIIDAVSEVGTWPVLNSEVAPTDSDNDGIPDYWEDALGWDPNAANNNHVNPDGYTDLEWYLNWLAGSHAVCGRTASVEMDLRQTTGGLTNLAYTVSNGTNGTVVLLEDGYTARFTRASASGGLADFSYTCSNTVTGVSFGPLTMGLVLEVQPVLLWDRVAGGLEFSWDGAWVLQYLTNSLINTTNWSNYPDTGNPVTVPVDSVHDTVFFRLSE